jgi:hypothetical protein
MDAFSATVGGGLDLISIATRISTIDVKCCQASLIWIIELAKIIGIMFLESIKCSRRFSHMSDKRVI